MRRLLNACFRLLAASGACRLGFGLTGGRPRILMYHGVCTGPRPDAPFGGRGKHVSASAFERQMAWLKRHARVLSMDELVEALGSGASLPRRAVVVTLDDGYRNNHEVALPILERYGLPAIVYVTTGFVEGQPLWVDRVDAAVETARGAEIFLSAVPGTASLRLPIGDPGQRLRAGDAIRRRGKTLDPGVRERFVREVTAQAEWDLGDRDEAVRPADTRALDSRQVRDLVERRIGIGCHTSSHATLTRCDDEDLRRELVESRQRLERWTGRPVHHFAYPNGQPGDFDERTERAVRVAGFRSSLSTVQGTVRRAAGAWSLPRIPVNGGEPFHLFLCDIAGIRPAVLRILGPVRGRRVGRNVPEAEGQATAVGPSSSS